MYLYYNTLYEIKLYSHFLDIDLLLVNVASKSIVY